MKAVGYPEYASHLYYLVFGFYSILILMVVRDIWKLYRSAWQTRLEGARALGRKDWQQMPPSVTLYLKNKVLHAQVSGVFASGVHVTIDQESYGIPYAFTYMDTQGRVMLEEPKSRSLQRWN